SSPTRGSMRLAGAARAERDRLAGKRMLPRVGELGGVVAVADDVVGGAVRQAADVVRGARGALVLNGIAGVQHTALAEIDQAVAADCVEDDGRWGEEAGAEQPRAFQLVAGAAASRGKVDRNAGDRIGFAPGELDLAVAGVDDVIIGVVEKAADGVAAA